MSVAWGEVQFGLEAGGVAWRVVEARATEGLSALYECSVEAATDDFDVSPPRLLGAAAALTLTRGSLRRRFVGVVAAVEDKGVTSDQRVVELTVVPSLWLLGQRSDRRVFQDADALSIVREVLRSAGIYQADGQLVERLSPQHYRPREYCVQCGETDLDFVRRLLEEEGVSFYFPEGDVDALALADASAAGCWAQVPTLDGGPVEAVADDAPRAAAEWVRQFVPGDALRPTDVTARDTDFTHPDAAAAMTASRPATRGARSLYEFPGRFVLGPYDEGGRTYGAHDGARKAQVRFEAEAVMAQSARGQGNVTGFSAGAAFALRQSLRADVPERYLVTRVIHVGSAPEVLLPRESATTAESRYRNLFECVPAETPYRPPRVTPKTHAAPQSAVVVAAPSSSEEIETDAYGRVLVRFAWDRPERRSSAQPERASCWLRVAQAWSGDGWGVVFTPRVGTEVLVQFLDGDPDRPVVTGCLYNAGLAPPVELPAKKSQSVLRTRSTPGSDGYNELRFEDLAGEEEVSFHAQRDHREKVLRDHRAEVDRDEALRVGRDQTAEVERHRKASVGGDDTLEVEGKHGVVVHGSASLHSDGKHTLTADEKITVECGGGGGSRVVLEPDGVTIEGSQRLTLKCGGAQVALTPSKVVLSSGSGATVELDGAMVTINGAATVSVQGGLVKINS